MAILYVVFISITALLHVLFFKTESLDFMKEATLKKFRLNANDGQIVRLWAFNQGFYNLFLALGLFYSLFLWAGAHVETSLILARFILLTIAGAGFVLALSARLYPAALLQMGPALLAFILSFLI